MSNTEKLDQLPPEVRPYVAKWIEQGRSEEQIYGVLNFFTGAGANAIQAAKVELLEELREAMVVQQNNPWGIKLINTELSKLREPQS